MTSALSCTNFLGSSQVIPSPATGCLSSPQGNTLKPIDINFSIHCSFVSANTVGTFVPLVAPETLVAHACSSVGMSVAVNEYSLSSILVQSLVTVSGKVSG